jgi:hypothetical protein
VSELDWQIQILIAAHVRRATEAKSSKIKNKRETTEIRLYKQPITKLLIRKI